MEVQRNGSSKFSEIDFQKLALEVLSVPRNGYRTFRKGFPNAAPEKLPLNEFYRREGILNKVIGRVESGERVSMGNRPPPKLEDLNVLDTVFRSILHLSKGLDGRKPSVYQLAALLLKNVGNGDLTDKTFMFAVKSLRSEWFSKIRGHSELWSGPECALVKCLTLELKTGRFKGETMVSAMEKIFEGSRSRLFLSREVIKALELKGENKEIRRLTCSALQFLITSGRVIEHPQQAVRDNRSYPESVWSLNSGKWIKPAILNPELAVLSHASKKGGAWLFELYSNTGNTGSIFNHHTIIAAARRLESRGLVKLSKERFDSKQEGYDAPNNIGVYEKVSITKAFKPLVRKWLQVPIGGELNERNYGELRKKLVERSGLR